MYETGSASGVVDLITKLEVFMAANGWTTDSFATEGTGKRYHAHRGSVYFNARAYAAETVSGALQDGGNTNVSALAMNLSTAATGGSAWFDNPGAPATSAPLYHTAGLDGLSAAIPAYHFFAHNSGDQIVVVVEYASGYYQWLVFGTLAKFGTYTGGAYFTGSRHGLSNLVQSNNGFVPGIGFFSKQSQVGTTTSPAFVSVSVDSETGWHWSDSYSSGRDAAKRYIVDNFKRYETTLGIQPNTLNSLAVMMPVVVSVERGTTSHGSERLSPLGELPGVYFLRISSLTPGQQITLGSDDYRVFPFYYKNNAAALPSSIGTGHSSYYGFAVKE